MTRNRKHLMTDSEMKEWLETMYDVNENGCWVWRRMKDKAGYGKVKVTGGYMDLVHRVYWGLSGRTIPEGLNILHGQGCSKACYNPDHLRADTQHQNQMDRFRDGTMVQATLTPEQVLEIRATMNMTQEELATKYGVNQAAISKILLRKTWKHI